MIVMKLKNQKLQEKCVIKHNLKFKDYKYYLETTQLENKIEQLEKSKLIKIIENSYKKINSY